MEYLAEEAEQFTVHTNLTVDAALEMAFNGYKPKERKVAQKMMTNALEEDFCAQHEFNGFTMNVEEDEVAFWVDWDTAGITAFVTWLTARLETAEIPLSAKNHEAYVGKSKTERNLIYVLRSDITEDLEVDLGKMGFDDPDDEGAIGFTGFAPVEDDEEESDDSVDADGDDMKDDGDDNDDNHEEKGMKSNKEKNVGSGCRSRNPGLRTPERKVGIAHPRLRMRTNNVPRSYESRSYVLLQWEYRPHASAGYHTRLPHHNVQPLSGGSPLRLDSGWVSPFDR
jgi:hypothetical protein